MAFAAYPDAIIQLIAQLKRLPGIGPRSAEKMAIWMLQHTKADPLGLAASLTNVIEQVQLCPTCGFFSSHDQCALCDDPRRDGNVICIVEQVSDIMPIERSAAFNGRYHCLGGKLSPLDQIGPEHLRIGPLLQRIRPQMEIIFALGSDVEGEATAHYLMQLLTPLGCSLTRIAQGMPAGGMLEHADELTVRRAILGRRIFD